MIKHVNRILDDFFKGRKKGKNLSNFYKVIGTENADSSINMLFFYINSKIGEYDGYNDLDCIYRALDMVDAVVSNNINVDRNKLKRKVRKTIEHNDRIKIEKKDKYALCNINKVTKKLNKLNKTLLRLDEVLEKKDCGQYEFLMCIIEDTKNLSYLEQTLYHFPNYVNVVDKDGKTLFNNIVEKYVKTLNDDISNIEDIHYYMRVINTIINHPSFLFTNNDKSECLKYLYNCIDNINSKDKKMKQKVKYLYEMTDVIIDDKETKLDFNKLIEKYNIHIGFNNYLIDEVNLYCKHGYKNKNEIPIVNDYVITIDDEIVSEIDDGLSVRRLNNGNYLLGIHISDPLSYFPFNSSIVKEAINRGSSIYIPDSQKVLGNSSLYNRVITMFPEKFSVYKASLREGFDALATSYYYELDNDANVINEWYSKTIVKSSKRCTYKDINNIIRKGCDDLELLKTVDLLNELTYKIEEKSKAERIYEDLKSKSFNPSNIKTESSDAGRIVGRLMTFNGGRIGEFFASNNYPTLYRVHSIDQSDIKKLEEEIEKISSIHNKDKFNKLYQTLLGIYPKAKYDEAGSHDGLGLLHYCHCTSPLRRSADLVVTHALDVCYFNRPTDTDIYKLEDDVKLYKDIINAKNDDIEQFLLDYNKQKSKCRHKKM